MREFSRRNAIALALGATGGLFALPCHARADKALLAIRGYDPVAYFTLGKPVRGLPEISMSGTSTAIILPAPNIASCSRPIRHVMRRSSPSFCTMALTRGELDEPNPEYWLVSDGKLYLFGKPVGPELFQQILQNLAKANGNRLTQKNSGQRFSRDRRKQLRLGRHRIEAGLAHAVAQALNIDGVLRNLLPKLCGSKVGSTRRLMSAARAASSCAPCWA